MSINFKDLANTQKDKWIDTNFQIINKDPFWKRIIKTIFSVIGINFYQNINAAKILETLDHKILDTFFDINPNNIPTSSNLDEISQFLRHFNTITHGNHKEKIEQLLHKISLYKYGSLPAMLFAKNTTTMGCHASEKAVQAEALLTSWKQFYEKSPEAKNNPIEFDDFANFKNQEAPDIIQTLKELHGHSFKTLSLQFEANLLKNFIRDIEKYRPTHAMNTWILGCLTHLQTKAEKLDDTSVKATVANLLSKYCDPATPIVVQQEEVPKLQPQPSFSLISKPEMTTHSAGTLKTIEAINMPALPNFKAHSWNEIETILNSWQSHLDSLKDAGKLEQFDRDLIQLMETFQPFEIMSKMINSFDETQITTWVKQIKYFVSSLVQNHYRLQRHPFPVGHIKNAMLLLELQILSLERFQKAHAKNSVLRWWNGLILEFRDHYISLGIHQKEFFDHKNRLQTFRKGIETGLSHNLNEFMKTSSPFIEAAETCAYLKTAIYEDKYLWIKKPVDKKTITDNTRTEQLKNSKQVRQLLSNWNQDIELVWNQKEETFKLEPLGLYFDQYVEGRNYFFNRSDFGFSNYLEQSTPITDKDFRHRICESALWLAPRPGQGQDQRSSHYYSGNNPLHDTLLDEDFVFRNQTREQSYSLQLACTSNYRLRQLLLHFCTHPSTLDNPQLMRILVLSFTSDFGAYGYFKGHPEHLHEIFEHIKKLDGQQQLGVFPQTEWTSFVCMVSETLSQLVKDGHLESNDLEDCAKEALNRLKNSAVNSIQNNVLKINSLDLLRHYLFAESQFPSRERNLGEWTFIFKAYLVFNNKGSERHLEEQVEIARLIDSYAGKMLEECKKNPALVDEIISYCYVKKDQPRNWEFTDSFLIQSPEIRLDLRFGEVAREAQVDYYIPKNVQKYLKGILPAETFKKKHSGAIVCAGDSLYVAISLEGADIWLPFRDTDKTFIDITYTNTKGVKRNYSLVTQAEKVFKDSLPKDVVNSPCYLSADKTEMLFMGSKGEIRYSARTKKTSTGIQIQELTQYFHRELPKKVIINQPCPNLDLFLRISSKENLVFFGNSEKIEIVHDRHLNLTFIWDSLTEAWHCHELRGYYLSDDCIDDHYRVFNQYSMASVRQKPTVFRSTFNRYLLLKHAELPPKLIIPHNEFSRINGKYSPSVTAVESKSLEGSSHVFEVNSEKGLCGTSHQDYLYLSYIYLTQGRYVEAKHALSEGFLQMQTMDEQSSEILGWISIWNDKSPNLIALKLAIAFYTLELADKGFHTKTTLENTETQIFALFKLYSEYREKLPKISRQLQIPQCYLNNLHFYALRIAGAAGEEFLTKEDKELLSGWKNNPEGKEAILHHALNEEIGLLYQSIKGEPVKKTLTESECTPKSLDIFSYCEVNQWLKTGQPFKPNAEEVNKVIAELQGYFEDKDSYAKEIILDGIEDMTLHMKNAETSVSMELDTSKDLRVLLKTFMDAKQKILTSLYQIKQHIIANFQLDTKESSTLLDLKEISPIAEDLFKKGKQAVNDAHWKKLADSGVLTIEQLPQIKRSYHDYLKLRRELLQVNKVINLAPSCKGKPKDAEEVMKLGQLLSAKSPYDPDTFPQAHVMLLVEEELGIVLSEKQFIHITEMINNPSSFKQEIWGSGKTTVIRNIISKLHADGYSISGVFSDPALLTPHHKLLKNVATSAYGDQAYLNTFSRDVNVDIFTILNEHRKILQLIRDGGRMDQTLHTFVSMLHSRTLQLLRLHHNDPKVYAMMESLDDLLRLYTRRAIFGSDELDQVANPCHYHNYGEGKIKLNEKVYQPALTFMRSIRNDARFAHFRIYYSQKHTKQMSDVQRAAFLELLATVAIEQVGCNDLDATLLKGYLIGDSSELIIGYFHSHILNHAKSEEIMRYYILISQTIGTTFDRVSGVKYWRSEDGIHTKPCIYSGKCNEKGENSSIELTVWDTCVDYLRQGVNTKSLTAYINLWKQKSQRELASLNNATIDTTTSGREFKQRFGVKLTEVTANDFDNMSQLLTGNLEWMIELITHINFEEYVYSTGRIDGHAAYASRYMKELWGSSGNIESARAMPHKVNRHPHMYRQKGAAGHVYTTFIKEMNNGNRVETYDYSVPFEQYLATRLEPGSAFVDIAPFFEGLNNYSIAEKLSQYLPKERKVRFQGDGDDVLIRDQNGKLDKDIGLVDLKTTNTIFSKKDTRGTNLGLASNLTNVASLSCDTDITNFTQAIMRDRKYGIGSNYRYIQDQALQNKLAREDLKGLSTAAKYLIIFAEVEEANQKKLNYILNSQEITVTGIHAIQELLSGTTYPHYFDTLQKIRETNPKWLLSPSELPLQERATPKMKVSGRASLESLARKEAALLKILFAKLQGFNLGSMDPGSYLDKAANQLLSQNLIMDEKYLLDEVKGTEHDQDVMVVEVEAEVTGELETDIDIQVEQELSIEHEQSSDSDIVFEQSVRRGRPICRFGSNFEYVQSPIYQFAWGLSFEKSPDSKEDVGINYDVFLPLAKQFAVAHEIYPGTKVTLGPGMDLKPTTHGYHDFSKENWLYGYFEYQSVFYPVMYLFANEQGTSGAILGHAGDATYSDQVKSVIQKNKGEHPTFMIDYHLMSKVNIAEYNIPKNMINQFKEYIAMAKMIYGIAPLNKEEKAIITTWINAQPNKNGLIANFRQYCARHYSKNQHIDLLELFNSI